MGLERCIADLESTAAEMTREGFFGDDVLRIAAQQLDEVIGMLRKRQRELNVKTDGAQ